MQSKNVVKQRKYYHTLQILYYLWISFLVQGSGGQLSYSVAAIEALQTLDGMRVVITKPFFTIDPRSAVIIVNTSLEREEEIEGFHYYELTVSVP